MSPYVESFVMHIGEMGSRWGLNRTLGQMCGLLYLSPRPLNADEIADALCISRSNVSMGLKELKSWRLVQPASSPGDRREVQPTLSMLRDTLMVEPATDDDRYAQQRIREMHEIIELLTNWMDEVRELPPRTLIRLLKLGRRIQNLLDKRRKTRDPKQSTGL